MRDLDHYLDLIDEKATVGAQLLGKAIYAARHGDADEAEPDDLRPIVRDLPTGESYTTDRAIIILACDRLATDDGRDRGIGALADELGVHRDTVNRWVHGRTSPGGPAVGMARQVLKK
ncbi:MAG: hypothetical protein ABEN55_13515 [Bradymonadaceae bacterium]